MRKKATVGWESKQEGKNDDDSEYENAEKRGKGARLGYIATGVVIPPDSNHLNLKYVQKEKNSVKKEKGTWFAVSGGRAPGQIHCQDIDRRLRSKLPRSSPFFPRKRRNSALKLQCPQLSPTPLRTRSFWKTERIHLFKWRKDLFQASCSNFRKEKNRKNLICTYLANSRLEERMRMDKEAKKPAYLCEEENLFTLPTFIDTRKLDLNHPENEPIQSIMNTDIGMDEVPLDEE